MKLLIVAATKAEIAPIYKHFNLPDHHFVQQPAFDILITGVGMTATAFALGKHLNNTYQLVVNVGIAGSFDKELALGNLVNIYEDTFAELGAEDHDDFISLKELGFGEITHHTNYNLTGLPKVKGITVNKVHGNTESIKTIIKRLAPQTESMEGAAVLYACHLNDIPCVQVRSISNYVEPRAKENWKIGLAIKNLNEWLIGFIAQQTK
jgi:futalosine hydrolase